MSDIDVFETRFETAYRRYLAEAPTEVDAAAVARTVAAAHPRAGWLDRLGVFDPARAFVWVALLALLLVALGAVVLVGVPRPRLGLGCPPGSTPDVPGAVDQARPPSRFDGMVFDRSAGAAVVRAQGETWAFDVCANRWTRMAAAPYAPTGVRLVYDVDSDVTLVVNAFERSVWAYDLAADRWTRRSSPPWPDVPSAAMAYVPDDGLVVALLPSDPPELWTYAAETDRWVRVPQATLPGSVGPLDMRFLAFDPSVGRIVAYVARCPDCAGSARTLDDRTFLLDPRTGTWSQSAADTPHVYRDYHTTNGEIAYDESAGAVVIIAMDPDTADMMVLAYDAAADRWDTLWRQAPRPWADGASAGPGALLTSWTVYDSVNERLLVAGSEASGSRAGWTDDVWAFDTRTRAWTRLLAPTGP